LKALTSSKLFFLTLLLLFGKNIFAEKPAWLRAVETATSAKELMQNGDFNSAKEKYTQALKLLTEKPTQSRIDLVKAQQKAWLNELTICKKFSANNNQALADQVKQQRLEMAKLLQQNSILKTRLVNSGSQFLKIKALQDQVNDLKSERDALLNQKSEKAYLVKRGQQDQVYVSACLRAQQVYSQSYQKIKQLNAGLREKNLRLKRSIEDFKKQQRERIGSSFYETIQAKISDLQLENALLKEKIKKFGNPADYSPDKSIDILQEANYKLRVARDQFYKKLEQYTGDAFEDQVKLNNALQKENSRLEKELKHYKSLAEGNELLLSQLFQKTYLHHIALNQAEYSKVIVQGLQDEIRFLKEELERQKIITRLSKEQKPE
jgi:hypothetical protein